MSAGRPELVLIAAVARNGTIGRDNELVFRDAADLRHFRQATLGSPVLMGRKTWQSLPERFRPLPGRHNIVLSRDPSFHAPGASVATSLDDALRQAGSAARVFVIGGAQLYAAALPQADRLLLTEVDADLEGDAFFPPWNRADFIQTAREPAAGEGALPFAFASYRRR